MARKTADQSWTIILTTLFITSTPSGWYTDRSGCRKENESIALCYARPFGPSRINLWFFSGCSFHKLERRWSVSLRFMGLTKRPDKKRGRVQLATFREGASRIRLYDLLSCYIWVVKFESQFKFRYMRLNSYLITRGEGSQSCKAKHSTLNYAAMPQGICAPSWADLRWLDLFYFLSLYDSSSSTRAS